MRKRAIGIVLAAAALALYLGLLTSEAMRVKPWNDEAMSAEAAYNLGTQGTTGVRFFDEKAPNYPGITKHTYYIFPLQLCVLAVWYKAAGFSLLSTRVLSILWTCLMLAAFYAFLEAVTEDRMIASLATVLCALDYQFMTAAAFGRYDMMVAALGFSAYALYVRLRESHFRIALVAANACVMAAGATHPNGLIYLIGLWFLILYFDRRRLRAMDLSTAAVPYVAGAAIWAPFVLQDWPSFRGQLLMNSSGRVGILHPWDTFVREIRYRYITEFGLGAHSAGHSFAWVKLKALSLVTYLLGIVGCLATRKIRQNMKLRPVLVLAGIHWAYMTFYENMKFSYYLVHLLPLYCALLAVYTMHLWRSGATMRWAVAGLLALASLVQVGGILAKIRLNDYGKSYLPAVEFVRAHALPADQVNASCSFGFEYGFDRNLMDDPSLGYYNHKQPEFIVEEEIYDGWWEESKTTLPEVYAFFKRTLAGYDLIYDRDGYRVYRRR